MTKKQQHWLIVIGIIFIAALFRLWNLGATDLQLDGAINVYRAYNWFDFLSDAGQTSPLTWYGSVPWWANLSFSDHPPLVFFINNLFFRLFGYTSLIALIPYALAGIGTTYVAFRIGSELRDEQTGFLTALLYAVSSFAVWSSRTAYLEGMQIIWIALSILFFIRFLKKDTTRDLLLWSFMLGLALLSKYTAIYLIPPALLTILIWKRSWFKKPALYLAPIVTALTLTPVIIYNYFVYTTRGHFDAALSSMVGMKPEAFSLLSERSATFSVSHAIRSLQTIATNTSLLLFAVFIVTLIWLTILLLRKRVHAETGFILLTCWTMLSMFMIAFAAARFLTPVSLFIACIVALGISGVQKSSLKKNMVIAGTAVIILGELLFSINTNIRAYPFGTPGITFSPNKFYNKGFIQLEQTLREHVFVNLGHPMEGSLPENITFDNEDILLIDERMNWFSLMWHLRRYLVYHDSPALTLTDVFDSLAAIGDTEIDMLSYLKRLGAGSIWYVYTTEAGREREDIRESYDERAEELKNFLEESGIQPAYTFTNAFGETTFLLYNFDFIVDN